MTKSSGDASDQPLEIAVAVLVMGTGKRIPAFCRIEEGNGKASKAVMEYCTKTRPSLSARQMLIPTIITVSLRQLEHACSKVEVL